MAFIAPLFALAGIEAASVGTAATIAGSAIGAVGAIQQGEATKAIMDYNAQTQRLQGQAATAQGAQQYANFVDTTRQKMAAAVAAGGQSGFSSTEGSFRDYALVTGQSGFSDALTKWYEGQVKATGYYNNATADTFLGEQALKAGYLGAGAKILGGVASLYKGKGSTFDPATGSLSF